MGSNYRGGAYGYLGLELTTIGGLGLKLWDIGDVGNTRLHHWLIDMLRLFMTP